MVIITHNRAPSNRQYSALTDDLETPTLRRSPTNISIGDEYLGSMSELPQLEQKINDRIQQAKNNASNS